MTHELGTWELTGDLTKSPVNWKLFRTGDTTVIPKNQFPLKSPIPIKYTPLLTLTHTVHTAICWVPSYSANSRCDGRPTNNQSCQSCKWRYNSRSQTDAICMVAELLNPSEGMVPSYGQKSWVPSSRHKPVGVRVSGCGTRCGLNMLYFSMGNESPWLELHGPLWYLALA